MNKKTKIIMTIAIVGIVIIGIIAFVFIGNPKRRNIDTEEKVPENVESETTLPGAVEEDFINYNDTPEGKAEIERLGFEDEDKVQVRPDVISVTQEEVMQYVNSVNSASSDYKYSTEYTLDETRIPSNMQWASVYQNMYYQVAASIISQYSEDNNLDPYSFDCELFSEPVVLENGHKAMSFFSGDIELVIVATLNTDTGELVGYLYEVREH